MAAEQALAVPTENSAAPGQARASISSIRRFLCKLVQRCARGIRYKSHESLPEAERFVRILMYVGQLDGDDAPATEDELALSGLMRRSGACIGAEHALMDAS